MQKQTPGLELDFSSCPGVGAVRAGCPGRQRDVTGNQTRALRLLPWQVLSDRGSFVCVVSSRSVWQQARTWLVSSSGPPPPQAPPRRQWTGIPQPPQRCAPGAGGPDVVMVVGTCALSTRTHFPAVHFGANAGLDSRLIGDVLGKFGLGMLRGCDGFLVHVFVPFPGLPSWGPLHVLAQRLAHVGLQGAGCLCFAVGGGVGSQPWPGLPWGRDPADIVPGQW